MLFRNEVVVVDLLFTHNFTVTVTSTRSTRAVWPVVYLQVTTPKAVP